VLLGFAAGLGAAGLWWSYPVGNGLAAVLCLAWFLRGRWRRRLAVPA